MDIVIAVQPTVFLKACMWCNEEKPQIFISTFTNGSFIAIKRTWTNSLAFMKKPLVSFGIFPLLPMNYAAYKETGKIPPTIMIDIIMIHHLEGPYL